MIHTPLHSNRVEDLIELLESFHVSRKLAVRTGRDGELGMVIVVG